MIQALIKCVELAAKLRLATSSSLLESYIVTIAMFAVASVSLCDLTAYELS